MSYLKMSPKGSHLLISEFFFPPLLIFYLFSQQLTRVKIFLIYLGFNSEKCIKVMMAYYLQ